MEFRTDITAGIVFSTFQRTRETVEAELRELGIERVKRCENAQQCREALSVSPDAAVVLDWGAGQAEIVNALVSIQKINPIVPPTLLLAPNLEPQVVGTAYEYSVSQIHASDVSSDSISISLKSLLTAHSFSSGPNDVLRKVTKARNKGDWSGATKILEETVSSVKENPRIAVELAENYIRDNDWQRATKLLEKYLTQDPKYIRLMHLYGRCLLRQRKYDDAASLLEKAQLLNPFNSERLINLGDAFVNLDQIDKAKTSYGSALDIDPDSNKARAGVGKCALVEGDINAGLLLLKELSDPREVASVFNSSAILNVNKRNYDLGMMLYERALALLGQDNQIAARLIFNKGIGHKKQGKPEMALQCFEKAFDLDPSFKRAVSHKDALKADGQGTFDITKPDLSDELIDDADLEEFSDLLADDDE